MLSLNGRKLVGLVTSGSEMANLLKPVANTGLGIELTSTITECVHLISKSQPEFVLLAYDHPEFNKILVLAQTLLKNTKCLVVGYVENDKPAYLNRLNQSGLRYQIWPPLSSRGVQRTLEKALNENPERFYKSEKAETAKPSAPTRPEKSLVGGEAIAKALQSALDKVCKVDPSTPDMRAIQDVEWLMAVPVVGGERGYILATASVPQGSSQDPVKALNEVVDFAAFQLQSIQNDIRLDTRVLVETPRLEFQSLAFSSGSFTKAAYHHNFEVAFTFVPEMWPLPKMESDESNGKAKVKIGFFSPGRISRVPLYLKLPDQEKLQTLVSPGGFLSGSQIDKLKKKSNSVLYIDSADAALFRENFVQNNVLKIIENYAFASIERDLRTRLAKKRDHQRMKDEILSAQHVQDCLFPESHYTSHDFELRGHYERASETGGDWWHYEVIGRKAYFFIGDATGHGLPAAMVTSAVKAAATIIRDIPNLPIDKIMSLLNRSVYATGGGNVLMTFFLVALDLDTGEYEYSSASHESPFILPATSQQLKKADIRYLDIQNAPRLGDNPKSVYPIGRNRLKPGDRMLFFTDGITELENSQGVQWGERRFLQSLIKAFNSNSGVIAPMQLMTKDMEDFRRSHNYVDDVTCFIVLYKPDARAVKSAA